MCLLAATNADDKARVYKFVSVKILYIYSSKLSIDFYSSFMIAHSASVHLKAGRVLRAGSLNSLVRRRELLTHSAFEALESIQWR